MPFPFLATPFILTFWAVWFLADGYHITKLDLAEFSDNPIRWGVALLSTLGSALFAPSPLTGAIFLGGILISRWAARRLRCAAH
jgi:urea transporter